MTRDSTLGAPHAPLTPDGVLPPAILSNVPGTWAHDTVSRRLRDTILSRVFADNAHLLGRENPDADAALKALDAELADAAASTLRHITPDGGPDLDAWRAVIEPWVGCTWLDTPWLVSEFYFYRRILEALGYFSDGPNGLVDPFQKDKDAGLAACVDAVSALAPHLNAFSSDTSADVDELRAGMRLFVLISLWGNRMDLSIWPAGGAGATGAAGEEASATRAAAAFNEALSAGERCLLHDDSTAAAAALMEKKNIGLVVDNAGFELVCDLALADAIVSVHRRAGSSSPSPTVTLHVKAHPTFVSDAMDKDVRATVEAMCESVDKDVAAMGRRWRGHIASGAWVIRPDFAWAQPQPLWELPVSARSALAAEDVVVIKGDANYRRLLGDRLWALDTPFAEVAAYFPAPLLALRTLKAELGCGIPAAEAARAAAEDPEGWQVSGKFGVVQYLPEPAGQAAVAALAWNWGMNAGTGGSGDVSPAPTAEERKDLALVLMAMSNACKRLADRLAAAPLRATDSLGQAGDAKNATGDAQKKLDIVANDLVRDALANCGAVRHYCSEEEEGVIQLTEGGRFVVVCDPLDGSRNIECNVPTGTIFGVYRCVEGVSGGEAQALRPGSQLVAAGYANYSAATNFVVAVAGGGNPVELDVDTHGEFRVASTLACPTRGQIYSLNDARFDDWPEGLQRYISDVRSGNGQTGKQYSARYVCSLVADVHRTLMYGGWAGNPRPHLRLVYEAAPLAFVVAAAGGMGSDGVAALVGKTPEALHERTCCFLGSVEDVAELESYGDVQQGVAEYAV